MNNVKIGFAPTRRSIFSAPDAVKYANLTREKLRQLGVDFVDIDDISNDGLLYCEEDEIKIAEKFKAAGVDGLFFPHTNFGTEYEVCRLAKRLNVPVLLWGPRDEAPLENGVRLRDTQCGLFATGKVLRRYGVKFTYLCNCRLDDEEFERGINNFLAVCNTVKTFRKTRILQIGPRPYDFFSTMCNEGELLEKYGIETSPVPLCELFDEMKKADEEKLNETITYCKENFNICVKDNELEKICRMKVAMRKLANKYGCNAIAIQCWNAMQSEIGIMPCAANSLLNEEGLPVVCETDIHGAITSVLVEAATLNTKRSFFSDWTVRHPYNENGELLQHCGPWPISCASCKPSIGYPLAFDHPGAIEALAKKGEDKLTIARFDGDHGEYSLLLGNAIGIDGPYTKGTYMWIEVKNMKRLEAKIVEGPYIHHCVGVHQDVVPVLYEACKYLNIKADLYDDNEEEVKAYIRGE